MWDVTAGRPTGRTLSTRDGPFAPGDVVFSADSRRVFTVTHDGTAQAWARGIRAVHGRVSFASAVTRRGTGRERKGFPLANGRVGSDTRGAASDSLPLPQERWRPSWGQLERENPQLSPLFARASFESSRRFAISFKSRGDVPKEWLTVNGARH